MTTEQTIIVILTTFVVVWYCYTYNICCCLVLDGYHNKCKKEVRISERMNKSHNDFQRKMLDDLRASLCITVLFLLGILLWVLVIK